MLSLLAPSSWRSQTLTPAGGARELEGFQPGLGALLRVSPGLKSDGPGSGPSSAFTFVASEHKEFPSFY